MSALLLLGIPTVRLQLKSSTTARQVCILSTSDTRQTDDMELRSRRWRSLPAALALGAASVALHMQAVSAQTSASSLSTEAASQDECTLQSCNDGCVPISCFSSWWRCNNAVELVAAAVLLFFATFLPRVLVRLVIFVLSKLPFLRQFAVEFRASCAGSTSYLISASLVFIALAISDLSKFLCRLPIYIWGLFFLYWLYSLFNVAESIAVRRYVGADGDLSKKMVISESVKILRLTTLVIIALIIYSSALGDSETLKYSVLIVIGLAIALGIVPSFHNVVGGLFLAFNSQFKIDDFIHVGNAEGFVHRVSLRYTTVVSLDGTMLYVPNSFFLYKPMINFSQRPKRDIDIRVRVSHSTSVVVLRECLDRLEKMLQSLHVGLTSHEESLADLRHGDKWPRFFFVAMEELFEIRVYSYSEELDSRKFAMIKSEVWLAVMEIMEELGIEVLSDSTDEQERKIDGKDAQVPALTASGAEPDPFTSQMSSLTGAVGVENTSRPI